MNIKYQILFRACDKVESVHKVKRPFGLTKIQIIKVSFYSMYQSLQGSQYKFTIIGDDLSTELLDSVNKPHRVLNICGKTTIDELPLAVNDMDCIVTGDTGILHLAIALEKRTISLFGSTDHREYGPYQDVGLYSVIQVEGAFLNHLPRRQRGQAGMRLIETDSVLDELEKCMGF